MSRKLGREIFKIAATVSILAVAGTAFYAFYLEYNQPLNQLNDEMVKLEKELDRVSTLDRLRLTKDILAIKKDQVIIKNGIYAPLIQVIGAVGVFLTVYVGYKNFIVGRENGKTGQFSKAIELLGSSNNIVRLGGIYFLEKIMTGYADQYHWTIVETLVAFIESKCSKKLSGTNDSTEDEKIDIRAAIQVLAKRDVSKDKKEAVINLKHMNLQEIDLSGLELKNFIFSDSDLTGATLNDADLRGASLNNTNLSKAQLENIDFRETTLSPTELEDTNLQGAKFQGSILTDVNLQRATLIGANFTDAIITTTNFTGSNLRQAIFHNTQMDGETTETVRLTPQQWRGIRTIPPEP
jgi:uncharacterized protein YjbI with pentapeptide repeats